MLAALLIVTRAVHIAASILLAGTLTFEVVSLGSAGALAGGNLLEVERRLFRLVLWSVVAALISAVLWFWLEVVNMSGLSFANSSSLTAFQTVLLETKFGHVWGLRLGVVAMTFVLSVSGLARDGTRRRPLILILWFLSVVLVISLAWISHAAAVQVQPLGLVGDALHLCAACGWIGGLAPLAIFLTQMVGLLSSDERIALVLERFSTLSLCCVVVLVFSGICNSWLLVGSFQALFTTPYGQLLILKLVLFGILLVFGTRNRLAIKSRRLKAQTALDLSPQLRRNVICEACLGAAVVAIVACLGVTPPARH